MITTLKILKFLFNLIKIMLTIYLFYFLINNNKIDLKNGVCCLFFIIGVEEIISLLSEKILNKYFKL